MDTELDKNKCLYALVQIRFESNTNTPMLEFEPPTPTPVSQHLRNNNHKKVIYIKITYHLFCCELQSHDSIQGLILEKLPFLSMIVSKELLSE